MDMDERCSKCGEGCEKIGDQWKRCADLSDEEWLALFGAGLLLFSGIDGLDLLFVL